MLTPPVDLRAPVVETILDPKITRPGFCTAPALDVGLRLCCLEPLLPRAWLCLSSSHVPAYAGSDGVEADSPSLPTGSNDRELGFTPCARDVVSDLRREPEEASLPPAP